MGYYSCFWKEYSPKSPDIGLLYVYCATKRNASR
jgi:hypothetical protein